MTVHSHSIIFRIFSPLFAGLFLANICLAQGLGPCTIETVAGSDTVFGEGMPATEAELFYPTDARQAPDGSLWISERSHDVIRRIGPDGILRTMVGTGVAGFAGDGGPAREAHVSSPDSLVFAPDGTLYFYDRVNSRIRRVGRNGIIDTVVGSGSRVWAGEDVPALEASLDGNVALAFLPSGDLVFAVSGDHRVRRLTKQGRVVTIAGTTDPGLSTGGHGGDGGPASEAQLHTPEDIAVAPDGTIYIAEYFRQRIRRIAPDGMIDTYLPHGAESPNGTPVAQATAREASKVEVDADGILYWRDFSGIRRVSPGGLVETVAEIPRDNTQFSVGPGGAIHTVGNQTVYKLIDGQLVVAAGTGPTAGRGDGGPATAARLRDVGPLAVGPNGELYIADYGLSRVRVVGTDGIIRNFAGTGERVSGVMDGPARSSSFGGITDIAADRAGSLYIAEFDTGWLSRVDANGYLTTVIPPAPRCRDREGCGDGGPANEAEAPRIQEIAVDSVGNIYLHHERPRIGERNWLRRVRPDGIIESIPRILPTGKEIDEIRSIAISGGDHLIVSVGMDAGPYWQYHPDSGWSRRQLTEGFLLPAINLVEGNGNLFVTELFTARQIRRMTPDGTVTKVAGGLETGFAGDGGPARDAVFLSIDDLALDAAGNLYISDLANERVRRINRALDCPALPAPAIAYLAVRNAANYFGVLAPGAIFTAFGRRLGPEALVISQIQGDRFPTELAGVRALIDGIPAPLIYASAGQLSGIVPYGVEIGKQLALEIEYGGLRSEPSRLSVIDAAPGIFTLDASGRGQGAILNQDLSLNGATNPAAAGSVIVLYATGEGLTDPPGVDGKLAGTTLPKPVLPVRVRIGAMEAEVLYGGAAPGLTAGVMQVNVRIPAGLVQKGPVGVELRIGEQSSGSQVTVSVGP